MTSLLLLVGMLDLAGAHAPANLDLRLSAPREVTAGKMTPVRVTLKNLGTESVRVVVEDCARAPFAVLVDGRPLPSLNGCDDRFTRSVELAPGGSTSDEIVVALKPGRHHLAAGYQADTREAFAGPLRSESQPVTASHAVVEVDE